MVEKQENPISKTFYWLLYVVSLVLTSDEYHFIFGVIVGILIGLGIGASL